MKRLKIVFSLLLMLSLTLSGCGKESTEKNKNTGDNSSFPVTLQDSGGNSVTVGGEPVRIISLIPAATETLFALGMGDKVVACSQWDNYPKDVQSKMEYIFDDALNPNTEQIVALDPDLIVIGAMSPDTTNAVRNLGIPCYIYDPKNVEETYDGINNIGLLTGSSSKAKTIVEEMQSMAKDIAEKVKTINEKDRARVWLEVDNTLFTAGKNTFMDELIHKAGGVNIAGDTEGWVQFSEEQIIEKNPQIILVTYGYYDKDAVKNILARPAWKNIDAITGDNVVEIDNDMTTRPGPRIIEGLKSICQALYPRLFK